MVNRDFISIQGGITHAIWNEELKRHVFINAGSRERVYNFCHVPCLEAFITQADERLKKEVLEKLRAQVRIKDA